MPKGDSCLPNSSVTVSDQHGIYVEVLPLPSGIFHAVMRISLAGSGRIVMGGNRVEGAR